MASVASEICPVRGVRPPCSAVQDATTDDTAPAASGASQAADPDRRSPRNPQLLPVPSSDSAQLDSMSPTGHFYFAEDRPFLLGFDKERSDKPRSGNSPAPCSACQGA